MAIMVGSSSGESPKALLLVMTNEALLMQSEERRRPRTQSQSIPSTSRIESNWPSLSVPSESSSPIQPGQKSNSPSPTQTTTPWKVQRRDPEDYERDRVGKYAEFFKLVAATDLFPLANQCPC